MRFHVTGLLAILLILCGSSKGFGQVNGHDILGLQSKHFSAKEATKAFHSSTALGILDYTFNPGLTNIIRILDTGRISVLRVHLINGSCIRRNTCGKYYRFRFYTKKTFNKAVLSNSPTVRHYLRWRTKIYCKLLTIYPHLKLLLSPAIEHNLSRAAWLKAAQIIKNTCQVARLVNNPEFFFNANAFGAWDEYHGTENIPATAKIVSTDGFDIKEINKKYFLSRTKKVRVRLAWEAGYNCLSSSSLTVKFIDPRDRNKCGVSAYAKNFY